ncbi:MAG: ROK family protein [Deltaproteobacteria bacterium]|nr:ROK family protein [Deltaproteobacteria bacterium]
MKKKKKPITIGVDLGGTKVKLAIIDKDGAILFSRRYATNPQQGHEGVIADIAGHVKDCLRHSTLTRGFRPSAIGVGVAGQVDSTTGIVQFAPNLVEWENVPLKKKLEKRIGLPVLVTNDVRAATYGEWFYGAGEGVSDLVGIFVGTGIGGGIVSGGRMLEGFSNTAGELGHITIVTGGRRCHCSNLGCLEAYAGGWAITERAKEAVQDDIMAGRKIIKLAGGIENITAASVGRAYKDKDPLAAQLIEQTGKYLSAGMVSIVNALNPRLIILGGGVIENLPALIPMVKQGVKKHSLQAAARPLKIVKAKLGDNAAAVGAAAWAREAIAHEV